MAKSIHILGVTGSIGDTAAKVIGAHKDEFDVRVVSAHRNVQKLAERAQILGANVAVVMDDAYLPDLEQALAGTGILASSDIYEALSGGDNVDITVAAIMGMAGLKPLLAAIKVSGALAIANKEPLVAAGALVKQAAAVCGCTLLPLDSEHNAIYQVFDEAQRGAIEKVTITASGGPFRTWTLDQMANALPEQALKHPNWSMGAKLTIDSATLMNKVLEVVEAAVLFDMPADKIDILIHPQSVVHSMVTYCDGSVLAQLGAHDMCTPLSNILAVDKRLDTPGERLDLASLARLDFEAPDVTRFPAATLVYEALEMGHYACVALNAANEETVRLYLEGSIGFLDIVRINGLVMRAAPQQDLHTLDDIIAYDKARRDDVACYI